MKPFWLNVIFLKGILGLNKTFDTIYLRPQDFNPIRVSHEAKSEAVCRISCVLAGDGCEAFVFKEDELKCVFGECDSDPIYVSKDHGLKIHVDSENKPAKHAHIAVFGGSNEVDMDISMKTKTSTGSPWFPDWPAPAPGYEWHPVGMFFEDGFLVCGGSGQLSCHHLKLGASAWTTVDSMIHNYTQMHQPGYIALGSNTFYVNGGYDGVNGLLNQAQTYFNGKWKKNSAFDLPLIVDRHCIARVNNRQVSIFSRHLIE